MSAEVAEVETPPDEPKVRGGEIPIFTKLKARNLYLVQALPYRAISKATGLPVPSLQQLAHREGWPAMRKQSKAILTQKADARLSAVENEALNAVAAESIEAAGSVMTNIRDSLTRTDQNAARDFQSYTGGLKNLVGVAKIIRDPTAITEGGSSINFNLFFCGQQQAEVKQVQPIDVSTKVGESTPVH